LVDASASTSMLDAVIAIGATDCADARDARRAASGRRLASMTANANREWNDARSECRD
jgi:hypothetical protein